MYNRTAGSKLQKDLKYKFRLFPFSNKIGASGSILCILSFLLPWISKELMKGASLNVESIIFTNKIFIIVLSLLVFGLFLIRFLGNKINLIVKEYTIHMFIGLNILILTLSTIFIIQKLNTIFPTSISYGPYFSAIGGVLIAIGGYYMYAEEIHDKQKKTFLTNEQEHDINAILEKDIKVDNITADKNNLKLFE